LNFKVNQIDAGIILAASEMGKANQRYSKPNHCPNKYITGSSTIICLKKEKNKLGNPLPRA
jgi:hypothetical protein